MSIYLEQHSDHTQGMLAFTDLIRDADREISLFDSFRAFHGLPRVWPSPLQHVVHFAVTLSVAGKGHTSVRMYLAGISSKH